MMDAKPDSEQRSLTCDGTKESENAQEPSNPECLRHTTVYIQDECLKHYFIRSRDTSRVFERQERLHDIKLGVAAGIARSEETASKSISEERSGESTSSDRGPDYLVAALQRMEIGPNQDAKAGQERLPWVTIKRTATKVDLLSHPAMKFVHGGDAYLENLISWARDSPTNIAEKGIEIPEGVPPCDLYCKRHTCGNHSSRPDYRSLSNDCRCHPRCYRCCMRSRRRCSLKQHTRT